MREESCLFIGFLRESGIIRLINSAESAGIKKIYLAIDGPRNSSERLVQVQLLNSAIKLAKELKVTLQIWQRDSNLGVAVSVITAIDWFFQFEERGIILEDDLDPHPDFYKFATSGLDYFESDSEVWLISGNQFFPTLDQQTTNSWSTYPLIWGWATWKNRWTEMRKIISNSNIVIPKNFPLRVRNFLRIGRLRSSSGKVDSWAIPLAVTIHSLGKYCVLPPTNLVSNLGVDLVAVHTKHSIIDASQTTQALLPNFYFSSQERTEKTRKIDAYIEKSLYGISMRHIFLPLYNPLKMLFLNFKNMSNSSLTNRLDGIDLPKL